MQEGPAAQALSGKLKFPGTSLILRESDLRKAQFQMVKLGKFAQKLFGANADAGSDVPDKLAEVIHKLSADRQAALDRIKALVGPRCAALLDGDDKEVDRLDQQSDAEHRTLERCDLVIEQLQPRLHQARERVFGEHRAEAIARHRAVLEMAFGKFRTALEGVALEQDHLLAVHEAAHDELVKFGAQATLPVRLAFNGIPTAQNVKIFRNCPGWATAGFGEKILSTEETGSDSSIG